MKGASHRDIENALKDIIGSRSIEELIEEHVEPEEDRHTYRKGAPISMVQMLDPNEAANLINASATMIEDSPSKMLNLNYQTYSLEETLLLINGKPKKNSNNKKTRKKHAG